MIEPIVVPKPRGTREIRELTVDEIQTLSQIFIDNGTALPDLRTATFIGAVQDGEVLGFMVLQMKLHAEPMWIKSGHSQLFTSIVREAENVILKKAGPQWCYLFTPAGRVTQMAAAMGMKPEPYIIMSKLVMPEAPARPLILMPEDESDIPIDIKDLVPASEVTQ